MNNGAVTLVYDGDGNRVAKTVGAATTQYLVDDLNPTGYAQVVEELAGAAVTRRYTYGLQRISQTQFLNSAWTTSFYGYDGFGSVRQLTDSTGAVTDTYDYDAWGNAVNVTGSTPNVYRYRGERLDPDLNLYYLRARYFNPLTGRFLTKDPATGSIMSPASLHKYLYAQGQPVTLSDPSGRNVAFEALLLRGALIGSVVFNTAALYMYNLPANAQRVCDIWFWVDKALLISQGIEASSGRGEADPMAPDWRDVPNAACQALGF